MNVRVERHTTDSPEATSGLGELLSKGFSAGERVGLIGELGAGKTRLVRGIAKGLGVKGLVKSPSFTIVNVYEGGALPLYHIDLYRITSAGEIYDAGLEEYIYGHGVTVIEWADSVPSLLDECTVVIRIQADEGQGRVIEIERRMPKEAAR